MRVRGCGEGVGEGSRVWVKMFKGERVRLWVLRMELVLLLVRSIF